MSGESHFIITLKTKPKVNYFNLVFLIDQNILKFNISMANIFPMAVSHRLYNLLKISFCC